MKVKVDAEADPALEELLITEWDLHKIQAQVGYRSLQEGSAFAKCHSDVIMEDRLNSLVLQPPL